VGRRKESLRKSLQRISHAPHFRYPFRVAENLRSKLSGTLTLGAEVIRARGGELGGGVKTMIGVMKIG